jgi:hypothetical protein
VRNDACQLGPEGERGEAEGISVRRGRHGTGLMVDGGASLHQANGCARNQLLLCPSAPAFKKF